jgi:N-acetylneuraminate synthase
MSTFIIAEIGINHNGSLDLAIKLIEGAIFSGCDAVKFQKRSIDIVYTKEELDKPRESPWGTTNREQKMGLEFGKAEYDKIDAFCRDRKIEWLASAWDVPSQEFLRGYDLNYNKVASAMLTHKKLLQAIAEEKKYTFISTGMSSLEQIAAAIKIFKDANCPFELMHCNSTYPCAVSDLNLNCIHTLKSKFNCKVGYSGHEAGISTTVAAVAMGATSIERHITLDRAMYGSDQAASVEVLGFYRLVKDIRAVEKAMGDGVVRVYDSEAQVAKKLRYVNDISL